MKQAAKAEGKVIRSVQEFFDLYMPRRALKRRESVTLGHVKVCPECGCRVIVWNGHDTFGYFLCYACGWSSMTSAEIGGAMAKESSKKLKLSMRV